MPSLNKPFQAENGFDANNQVISGVANPINNTDAANKQFVINASNLSTGTVDLSLLGTSGTRDSTTFLRGDGAWSFLSSSDIITSVNGKTGAVVLTKADLSLNNVENTALSTWTGSSSLVSAGNLVTTSISANNLVSNKVLISDTGTKITTSSVTATELNYLSGVTSNIQAQLNSIVSQTSNTYTASSTAANQVLDSIDISTVLVNTIKYIIQCKNSTNYHTLEMTVLYDGTNLTNIKYGTVYNNVSLISNITTNINNNHIELLVTPINANTIFKILRVTI